MQGRKGVYPALQKHKQIFCFIFQRRRSNYKKLHQTASVTHIQTEWLHYDNTMNRIFVDLHISSQWWHQRHCQLSMQCGKMESIKPELYYNTCWWVHCPGESRKCGISQHRGTWPFWELLSRKYTNPKSFFQLLWLLFFNLIWADRRCNEKAQPILSCSIFRGKQACPETLSPAVFTAQAEHAQVFPSTTLPFAPSALSLSWACPTPTRLPAWTTFNYPCSKCARLWRAFPYVIHRSLT